jgi:hypothetical protein
MHPRLKSIAIATGIAVSLGSLVGAILSVVPGGRLDSLSIYLTFTGVFFLQGMLFAIPVVLIYGVPLYYFMSKKGWTNFLTSTLFGALPSLVLVLAGDNIWVFALYYGIPIAVIYHAVISKLSRMSDKTEPTICASGG